MKLFISLLYSFLPSLAWGAACCGAAGGLPSIITGDDRAQLSSSFSYLQNAIYVRPDGVWERRPSNDHNNIMKIEGAHILSDRWQAGFSLPLNQNLHSTGLGDLTFQSAYELVPDWDYNPWRPHTFLFSNLITPTGKSANDDINSTGLDSTGRGFWSFGLGALLTKNWNDLDAQISVEAHRSFKKIITATNIVRTYRPGYGAMTQLGLGYSFSKLRLGMSGAWAYEEAIRVSGDVNSRGVLQRFATFTASASYLLNTWMTSVSYSDQSILGAPLNTPLNKSYMLLVQKRWSR